MGLFRKLKRFITGSCKKLSNLPKNEIAKEIVLRSGFLLYWRFINSNLSSLVPVLWPQRYLLKIKKWW